ncbi:hypothetical protein Rsub_11084 [Raphidocelis subcapitata]|uniref:Uncharacterized protein n=1 Tax=Raphidocelis subcapitata TaxID=307507 RepID=A0A2V0PFX7_9CHLO|nr:hypothetical protein Rsub_11084 [Raphidocelis subcapitata]|eukprot:GBF98439.1 hypothetical protein Rsub_11084 [Raphidocelis subcapitata]
MDLIAESEALFQDESVVLAALEVEKVGHGADATGAQLLKSLGAESYRAGPKPRVLCFSVKRSLSDREFAAAISLCRRDPRQPGAPLELRKTYPLKCLHDLRLHCAAAPGSGSFSEQQAPGAVAQLLRSGSGHDVDGGGGGGGARPLPSVEVWLAHHHSAPDHRGAYFFPGQRQAMLFMSLAVQLLRRQDELLPTLSGVSLERLDAWWVANKEAAAAALAPFAARVITPGTLQACGRRGELGVLVSAKEEADLEELLGLYALGLGEPEEFAARLQDEHAALEAANVYGLLESGPLVEGVLTQLRRTQGVLDDLHESLKVFDLKLRHMRDDIAAIEASNNSLERQSRNNAALLAALDRLLADIDIDAATARRLESGPLDAQHLPAAAAAAWALHDKRRRLAAGGGPGAVSPLVAGMRAVKDARARLDGLAQRFVSRAAQHVATAIGNAAGEAMTEGAAAGDRGARLSPPDRGRLREAVARCQPLVAALAALDPSALARLQMHYAQNVNSLLRRELRACSSELRRAVQAEAAGGEGAGLGLRERSVLNAARRAARPSGGSIGSASDISEDPGSASASPRAAPRTRGGPGAGAPAAARLAAYLTGASPGLPLHAAWQQLLGSFLPFLLEEADYAAAAFFMRKGDDPRAATQQQQQQQVQQQQVQQRRRPPPPHGGGELTPAGHEAVGALLGSLDPDFAVLVDLTSKSNQVMAVPMLALCRAWLARLRGRPTAAPLATALSACERRLAGHWAAFVAAQTAAVDAFDARSKIGLQAGIKNVHLLPPINQFVSMAQELEGLMADAAAEVEAGRGAAAARRRGSGEREERRQEGEDGGGGGGDGGGGAEEEAAADAAAAGAAHSVRSDVDAAYSSWAGRLFACLERQAALDAKYADRLRLENYGHYADGLAPLTESAPALRESVQQADALREGALAQYIQDQLEYGKMWKLLEFGQRLEKLLQVVTPAEVAFQKDCSASDARALMRSAMEGADKKLEAAAARVRKHLGATALGDAVWQRLKEDLLARYERLEQLLELCYPNTPLRPSPEELRELFKLAGSG